MAEFNGDLKPIVDFVGVTLNETKRERYLDFWRQAEFDFDTDDNRIGPDDFHFRIGLRATAFRQMGSETDRNAFEETIADIVSPVVNAYSNLSLRRVYVHPVAEADDSWRGGVARPLQASTDEVSRIWKEGHFRLFVSHSSDDKEFAGELATSLSHVRIDAFVAHRDIEPNTEWADEIKLGLASCHALAFICSAKSNGSEWCQQEVGWALGRGLFVSAYKFSADPRAFVGAKQAWSCAGHKPAKIRNRLLEFFVKEDKTEPATREPLVQLLLSSQNPPQLEYALKQVEALRTLNPDQVTRASAVLNLPFVSKSKPLKERSSDVLARFGYKPARMAAPSPDEYDPFADD